MAIKDILQSIPLFNRAKSILVCESDLTGLKAAVVVRKGNDIIVTHQSFSDNSDMSAAVLGVVASAREKGWRGKNAVLLSPAAFITLLEMPIAAKNKLAPKQIAEQIKYEIEPLYNQHLTQLTIGQLLIRLGSLTDEQVEDTLSHQLELNNTNVGTTPKRFGEVAESLGYISLNRVKAVLEKQIAFKPTGDDIQCGWSAQGAAIVNEAATGMHHWLGTAINKTLLRQWQAAFASQGIKLGAIYPLTGSATGLINIPAKGRKQQLLIEATQFNILGVQLVGDEVHGLHGLPNHKLSTDKNIAEAFHLLDHDMLDDVLVADSASENEVMTSKLESTLKQILTKPYQFLDVPAYKAANHQAYGRVSLGMLGVARHAMRMKGASLVSGVSVLEPQPPLMQHMGVRAALAGLALLGLIGVAEGVLKVREYLIDNENKKISKELEKVKKVADAMQAKVDEVKKLKDQIKALRENKKEVLATLDLLNVDLPKRSKLVITLLDELANATSDDVVVNKLSEDSVKGFKVEAWAINEKSAQEFIKAYQTAVHRLGYRLKDVTVAQSTGRLGLSGYSIDFSATTLPESEWQAQADKTKEGAMMPNGVDVGATQVSATIQASNLQPPLPSATEAAVSATEVAQPTESKTLSSPAVVGASNTTVEQP